MNGLDGEVGGEGIGSFFLEDVEVLHRQIEEGALGVAGVRVASVVDDGAVEIVLNEALVRATVSCVGIAVVTHLVVEQLHKWRCTVLPRHCTPGSSWCRRYCCPSCCSRCIGPEESS